MHAVITYQILAHGLLPFARGRNVHQTNTDPIKWKRDIELSLCFPGRSNGLRALRVLMTRGTLLSVLDVFCNLNKNAINEERFGEVYFNKKYRRRSVNSFKATQQKPVARKPGKDVSIHLMLSLYCSILVINF